MKTCNYCDEIIIQIGSRWFTQHDETHVSERAIVRDEVSEVSEPETEPEVDMGISIKVEVKDEVEQQREGHCSILRNQTVKKELDVFDDYGDQREQGNSSIFESNYMGESEASFDDDDEPGIIKEESSQAIAVRSYTGMTVNPHQCVICEKILKTKKVAVNHVKGVHGKLHDYKSFVRLAPAISDHLKSLRTTSEKPHQCLICNEVFGNAWSSFIHLKDFHGVQKNFKSSVAITEASANETGRSKPKPIEITEHDFRSSRVHCRVCSQVLPSVQRASAHMANSHGIANTNRMWSFLVLSSPSTIALFEESFKNTERSSRKRKRSSSNSNANERWRRKRKFCERPHECMICKKILTCASNAYIHLKQYHKICNNYRTFAKVAGSDTSHEKKPHKCLICRKVAVDMETAYRHIRAEHPSNTYLAQFVKLADVNPSECTIRDPRAIKPDPDGATSPHECLICNTVFNTLKPAENHLKTTHKIDHHLADFVKRQVTAIIIVDSDDPLS